MGFNSNQSCMIPLTYFITFYIFYFCLLKYPISGYINKKKQLCNVYFEYVPDYVHIKFL